MSLSIKNLLNKRYLEFKENISSLEIIDVNDLFPTVDESTNWVEVIEIILYLFSTDDTHKHLAEVICMKNINVKLTEEQNNSICEIIKKYLAFLKKIKNVL